MKFVYCTPRGGLNDSLNQIMRCFNYCQKFNRTLVINTYKNYTCYNDHFSNYFTFRKNLGIKIISKTDEKLINKLNQLSCFPKEISGKINNYSFDWQSRKF